MMQSIPNNSKITGTIEELLGVKAGDTNPRARIHVENSEDLPNEINGTKHKVGRTIDVYFPKDYQLLKKGTKIDAYIIAQWGPETQNIYIGTKVTILLGP